MEAKFVCNLKKYRVAQELTQEQLADIVGVRRETIMRLEKAQYNPSLKLAIDISRAVKAPSAFAASTESRRALMSSFS